MANRRGQSGSNSNNGMPHEARRKTSNTRLVIYFIFVILTMLPLVLPLIGTWADPIHDFSIYNTDWNGASQFREAIENDGYETGTLISSLNALNKMTDPGVLVILGPSILSFYTPTDFLALVGFILQGGSVVIADDFGSANTLFTPINALLAPNLGFSITFTRGVLHDYGSYYRNPVLPVIRNLGPHPVTQGVGSIMLNYAAAINISLAGAGGSGSGFFTSTPADFDTNDITVDQANANFTTKQGGGLGSAFGLLAFSSPYSWVDIDDDGVPDPENETAGPFPVALAFDLAPLAPLLGLNTSVPGKLTLISDPSIFVNEMWDQADNSLFARNLIGWMANNNQTTQIIFDEGHGAWPPTSTVLFYGLILAQTFSLSGLWIVAPLTPLFVVFFVKRWLPKSQEIREFKPTAIFRRRSHTRFSTVLSRYKTYNSYNQPLEILYRKWKREFVSTLRLDSWTTVPDLLENITSRRPDINVKRLRRYFKICENAKKQQKHISKEDFMNTFLGIKSILESLQGGEKYESL